MIHTNTELRFLSKSRTDIESPCHRSMRLLGCWRTRIRTMNRRSGREPKMGIRKGSRLCVMVSSRCAESILDGYTLTRVKISHDTASQ